MKDNVIWISIIVIVISIVCSAFMFLRHEKLLRQHSQVIRQLSKNDSTENTVEFIKNVKGIYKYTQIITWIAILYCICVCVHYTAVFYPRFTNELQNSQYVENLGIDYWGIVIGFLTLLITLLVGWQIYSTIKTKEEINNFTEKFELRLKYLETCCEQEKNKLNSLEDLKNNLRTSIQFEVYFAIMGQQIISDTSSDSWLQEVFNLYINPLSKSAQLMAKQTLLALFSRTIEDSDQSRFIHEIVNKIPQSSIEKLYNELLENREWIQYLKFSKVNDLFIKIINAYKNA